MKKAFLLLILFGSYNMVVGQSEMLGKVYYQSSDLTPAIEININANKSNGGISNTEGDFSLVFNKDFVGENINLSIGLKMNNQDIDINGNEVELVNLNEFRYVTIPNKTAKDTIYVIVCPKGSRDISAQKYYNIIKTSADKALKIKEQEAKDLKAKLGATNAIVLVKEKEIEQFKKLQDSVKIYREAYEIASINTDFSEKRVIDYLNALKNGIAVEEAIKFLNTKEAYIEGKKFARGLDKRIEELKLGFRHFKNTLKIERAYQVLDSIFLLLDDSDKNPLVKVKYAREGAGFSQIITDDLNAVKYYDIALNILENYIGHDIEKADMLYEQALSYKNLYRFKEAEEALNRSYQIKNKRNASRITTGDGQPASNVIHYDTRLTRINEELSQIYLETNQFDKAKKKLDELKALYESIPKYLGRKDLLYLNYGSLYYTQKKYDKAVSALLKSREYRDKLPRTKYNDPDKTSFNLMYDDSDGTFYEANYSSLLGAIYCDQGLYEASEKEYQKLISSAEKIDLSYNLNKATQANIYNSAGILYRYLEQYNESEKLHQKALDIFIKLAQINPSRFEPMMAMCYTNLGKSYIETKEFEKAENALNESLKIRSKYFKAKPSIFIASHTSTKQELANFYSITNRFEEAKDYYLQNIEAYTKIQGIDPSLKDYEIIDNYKYLGDLYSGAKKCDIAEEYYNLAIDISNQQTQIDIKKFEVIQAKILQNLGRLYRKCDQPKKSEIAYQKSIELKKKHQEKSISEVENNMGFLFQKNKEYTKAEQYYIKAIKNEILFKEKPTENRDKDFVIIKKNIGELYFLNRRSFKNNLKYNGLEVYIQPKEFSNLRDYSLPLNNLKDLYKEISKKQTDVNSTIASINVLSKISKELKSDWKLQLLLADKYYDLGKKHKKERRYDKAKENFLKSVEKATKYLQDDKEIFSTILSENYFDLGSTYYNNKEMEMAIAAIKKAIQSNEDLINIDSVKYKNKLLYSYSTLGALYLDSGDFENAEKTNIKALELFRKETKTNLIKEKLLDDYIGVLSNVKKLYTDYLKNDKQALIILEELINVLSEPSEDFENAYQKKLAQTYIALGETNQRLQNYNQSEIAFKKSLEIYKILREKDARFKDDFFSLQLKVYELYISQNKIEYAIEGLVDLLEVIKLEFDKDPETYYSQYIQAIYNLGDVYHKNEKYKEGEALYTKKLEELLLKIKQGYTPFSVYVPNFEFNIGVFYAFQEDFTKAIPLFIKSFQGFKSLLAKKDTTYQDFMMSKFELISLLDSNLRSFPEAEKINLEIIEILKLLPKTEESLAFLAYKHYDFGYYYYINQHFSKSEEEYVKCLQVIDILQKNNSSGNYQAFLADVIYELGLVYFDQNQLTKSKERFLTSLKIFKEQTKGTQDKYKFQLFKVTNKLAQVSQKEKAYEQAKVLYTKALSYTKSLVAVNPDKYLYYKANTNFDLGLLLKFNLNNPAEAKEQFLEANKDFISYKDDETQFKLGYTFQMLGVLSMNDESLVDSEHYFQSSFKIYFELFNQLGNGYATAIVHVLKSLGFLYMDLNRLDEAEREFSRALDFAKLDPNKSKETIIEKATILLDRCKIKKKQVLLEFKPVYKEKALELINECGEILTDLDKDNIEAIDLWKELNNYDTFFKTLSPSTINSEKIIEFVQQNDRTITESSTYEEKYLIKELNINELKKTNLDEARIKKLISRQYGSLSWYALFLKKFKKAENAAQEGIKLDSSQVWINANLALAYLLQGEYENAEKIYLKYMDVSYENSTYKETFLEDLNALEKEGITHKHFQRIRGLLNK